MPTSTVLVNMAAKPDATPTPGFSRKTRMARKMPATNEKIEPMKNGTMIERLKVAPKSDVHMAWNSRQGVAKLLTNATSPRTPSAGYRRRRTATYPSARMPKTGRTTLTVDSMDGFRERSEMALSAGAVNRTCTCPARVLVQNADCPRRRGQPAKGRSGRGRALAPDEARV